MKDGFARSVVIHGNAHWLTADGDLAEVEALGLRTYAPTYKTNWVRVEPVTVSGREFEIGQEPSYDL